MIPIMNTRMIVEILKNISFFWVLRYLWYVEKLTRRSRRMEKKKRFFRSAGHESYDWMTEGKGGGGRNIRHFIYLIKFWTWSHVSFYDHVVFALMMIDAEISTFLIWNNKSKDRVQIHNISHFFSSSSFDSKFVVIYLANSDSLKFRKSLCVKKTQFFIVAHPIDRDIITIFQLGMKYVSHSRHR